jgi:hypothetical protein
MCVKTGQSPYGLIDRAIQEERPMQKLYAQMTPGINLKMGLGKEGL